MGDTMIYGQFSTCWWS